MAIIIISGVIGATLDRLFIFVQPLAEFGIIEGVQYPNDRVIQRLLQSNDEKVKEFGFYLLEDRRQRLESTRQMIESLESPQ